MNNISIKGIIFGILTVLILDLISGIALISIFAIDLSEEAIKSLYHNNSVLIFSMFLGTISTVIGGFIAARFGKLAPYKNSSIIGAIGLILGVFLSGDYPLWFNILAFITTMPAALLGGYFIAKGNA